METSTKIPARLKGKWKLKAAAGRNALQKAKTKKTESRSSFFRGKTLYQALASIPERPERARMDPSIKAAWLAKLKSGTLEQGIGKMLDHKGRYDPFGVLCVTLSALATKSNNAEMTQLLAKSWNKAIVPEEVLRTANISPHHRSFIEELNDRYAPESTPFCLTIRYIEKFM